MYKSLKPVPYANVTASTDTKSEAIYLIDADTNFTTESFEFGNGAVITIKPTSIAGTGGSIKLQRSADGINYTDVYQDGSLVAYTVDNTLATSSIVYALKYGFGQLVYDAGSVTAGTLLLIVTRN